MAKTNHIDSTRPEADEGQVGPGTVVASTQNLTLTLTANLALILTPNPNPNG